MSPKKLNVSSLIVASLVVILGAVWQMGGTTRLPLLNSAAVAETDLGPAFVDGTAPLQLSADAFLSAYLSDPDRAEILISRQAEKPAPIASITKLFTALIATQSYEPEELIALGDERLGVRNLIHLLLIESNNQAADALAGHLGTAKFVDLMNQQARELNLPSVKFSNPHGLDQEAGAPSNYASANDLLRFTQVLLKKYPELLVISRISEYPLIDGAGHFQRLVVNTNQLINEPYFAGQLIGSKTGQTATAKKNLLVVLRRGEGYLVNIVLGSDDHFGDMRNLTAWIERAYRF